MLEQLILDMFDKQMIKFGEFTLKSGKTSYIYADIRTAISYPPVFRSLCQLLSANLDSLKYDHICGVPYSALAFASAIAYDRQIPMLLKRKEAKGYGTKKILEGVYNPNDNCVIIEDVVTTGMSITETTSVLEDEQIVVSDIVCFLERNQGGRENLASRGYTLHAITTLIDVIEILFRNKRISAAERQLALASIN